MNNEATFKKWIFNPAEYTAGFSALIIGIIGMALSALIAYYMNGHFDGAIDVHFGKSTPMGFQFAEVFGIWALLSSLLYISGSIMSKSSIRVVDVFGTMAMARLPLLPLLALTYPMLNGLSRFTAKVMGGDYNFETSDVVLTIIAGVIALFFIALTWIWMYKAYATSCNIKGPGAIVSFIIVLIIVEIISKWLLYLLRHTI